MQRPLASAFYSLFAQLSATVDLLFCTNFFLFLSRTKELNSLNEIAGTDLRQQKKQNEFNERIERFFFFAAEKFLQF